MKEYKGITITVRDRDGNAVGFDDIQLRPGYQILTIAPRSMNDNGRFLKKYATEEYKYDFTVTKLFVIVPDSTGSLMAVQLVDARFDTDDLVNSPAEGMTYCYLDRSTFPETLGIDQNEGFGGTLVTAVYAGVDRAAEDWLYNTEITVNENNM